MTSYGCEHACWSLAGRTEKAGFFKLALEQIPRRGTFQELP